MKKFAGAAALVVALLSVLFFMNRGPAPLQPAVTPPPPASSSAQDAVVELSPIETRPVIVEPPAKVEEVPDTIYLAGFVVDASGRRIPKSLIEATWTTGNETAIADEEGRFELPIPRNTFVDGALVIVRKVNYQGRVYDVPFRGEVQDDKLTGYLDSRLGQFPVTGERVGAGEGALGAWDTVTTYDGEVYPGLLTFQESPDGAITGSWEDELGPPELTRLVVPETITLSATLDALRAFPEPYEVPRDGRDDIALVMSATASIEGVVLDSASVPQSGWRVFARSDERSESADSDESGAFTLAGLASGNYEVFARSPQNNRRADASEEIALQPGENLRDLTLVYYIRQSLSGYITSSDGSPVQQAQISSWLAKRPLGSDFGSTSYSAQSDASGHYEITGIPEQQDVVVNLQVSHQDHMQTSRYGVLVDGAEQDFVMVKKPTIEGRVLDAVSRVPVIQFRLYSWVGDGVQEDDYLASAGRRDLEPHPDGQFSFQARGIDQVRIAVSAPGYATGLHRLSGVESGETVADVEILLQPIAPLTGTVRGPSGNPVRDARIFLGYPMGLGGEFFVIGSEGITQTGSSGAFVISEYPESLSVVSAYHPDYAPSWTNVTSSSTPLEIVLPQGGKLEGFVTYGGVPLENRRSHINIQSPSESTVMQTYTGDDGHYEIEKLPIGPVTLSVGFHEDGLRRYIHRDINIQSGETLRQDFDFGDAFDSFVEGTLLLNDRPVPLSLLRGVVEFENGDRVYYQTETAGDGSYRLGPIPAAVFEFGAIWILLEDGSYLEPPSETVTTRSGETTRHDIILVSD